MTIPTLSDFLANWEANHDSVLVLAFRKTADGLHCARTELNQQGWDKGDTAMMGKLIFEDLKYKMVPMKGEQ